LQLSCNRAGFPQFVQVETTSVPESEMLEQKEVALLAFHPQTVISDKAYFKALRIQVWAIQEVLLLTSAVKWKNGRYAQAYHRFIAQPPVSRWLKCRRTVIEPLFDLFSKVLGKTNNHKQVPLQRLEKVQPFLALGVLAVQVAMIINNIPGLRLHQISDLLTAFN
jgi:hypothetical protein